MDKILGLLLILALLLACKAKVFDRGMVVSVRENNTVLQSWIITIQNEEKTYGIKSEDYFAVGQKVVILKTFYGWRISPE